MEPPPVAMVIEVEEVLSTLAEHLEGAATRFYHIFAGWVVAARVTTVLARGAGLVGLARPLD